MQKNIELLSMDILDSFYRAEQVQGNNFARPDRKALMDLADKYWSRDSACVFSHPGIWDEQTSR